MIVVADTSVVLNLCCVGQVQLLSSLYGRVLVPVEVALEFRRLAGADSRFSGLSLPAWIEILPSPAPSAELAAANLDLGETAAIALCLSQSADALLVDESLGRAIALRMGLRTIGLLGILIDAKSRGLLENVAPILDDLAGTAGFWIAPALRARVLHLSGE